MKSSQRVDRPTPQRKSSAIVRRAAQLRCSFFAGWVYQLSEGIFLYEGKCGTLTATITNRSSIKPKKKRTTRVASTRNPFEKLTAIHPHKRITLETGPAPLTGRMIDLFAPLGFGQRALIVAPPKAGKTTILRHIAAAVRQNFPETVHLLCLMDRRTA